MQRVELGQSITLDATFTTGDGALTDPSALLVSIFDYRGVERVSGAAPTRLELGRFAFSYLVPSDGPTGAWTIRWDVTIDGVEASGQEAFDVILPGAVIGGGPGDAALFVTRAALELALGRPLTEPEWLRAQQLIRQLVRLLERRLNRTLVARTIVGEVHTIGVDGRLNLNHGPVAEVTAVRTGGYLAAGRGAELGWYMPGSTVTVDYRTTGTPDSEDVQGVVLAAVAAAIRQDAARAGTAVSAEGVGPVKSFTVEGLSISYGDADSSSSSAKDDGSSLEVGSLKGIGRLRRPVLL